LGSFSDAFKSGQQAKQNVIDRARQKESAETQKLQRAIEAARKWVTDVLAPVVAEVSNDIAADGNIAMTDNSNPPKISTQVTIARNGKKPSQLAFIVDENGTVNIYRDGSHGNTLGSITTVNRAGLQNLFIQTLTAIGRS
jgi:hypothetical protein